MGLLLLPVFLYLLFSIPIRPDTAVPNEYKKSLITYFPEQGVFNEKISLVFFPTKENQFTTVEKMRWFDQLFDKFPCYQMLIYSADHVFEREDVEINELSKQATVVKGIKETLFPLLRTYQKEGDYFILIDELGELRGVYSLIGDKVQSQAKTELFILLQNLSTCQKKS